MSNILAPLHVAPLGKSTIRFFKAPTHEPQIVWHVHDDLTACLGLPRPLRHLRIPEVCLQHLARQVHSLGPRPLYELFRELIAGADPAVRIEAFAEIDASFVRALGANDFPKPLIVAGREIEDVR